MKKEEAVNHLFKEIPLYDAEMRRIYVPDVTEPFQFHGIQVATFFVDEEEIVREINHCEAEKSLANWAYAVIPAPGSVAVSRYGRLDFEPFVAECPYEDTSPEKTTVAQQEIYLEAVEEEIRHYVEKLAAEGILARLVPEDVALEEMSRRTGIGIMEQSQQSSVQASVKAVEESFLTINCPSNPSKRDIQKVFRDVVKGLREKGASSKSIMEVLAHVAKEKQSAR